MSLLPPVILELRAKATELFATLGEVQAGMAETATETEVATGRMAAAFDVAAGAGKALLFGGLAAGAVIGGFSLEAAMAAQVVDAKLSTALNNAGSSLEQLEPQIKATDAQMRTFGFSNEDTNTALATLTTALKDPAQALADVSIAADLARQKNIDLNAAALLVAKTSEGQSKGLKSLGIDLPIFAANAAKVAAAQDAVSASQDKVNKLIGQGADQARTGSKENIAYVKATDELAKKQEELTQKQGAGAEMLAALTDRVKDGASAFGDTLQGKLDAAKAGLQDLGERIGNKLIPWVLKLIDGIKSVGDWMGKNQGVVAGFGIALGIVAGILMAVYIATKIVAAGQAIMSAAVAVATAAQWLFNLAMDANPVGLVILAIAALIAIVVLLATHWGEITKFLGDVWAGFINWMTGVMNGFLNWWNDIWVGVGNAIRGAFNGVANFISGIFNGIIDIINNVIAGINVLADAARTVSGGAINFHLGSLPHIPSLDVGGTVPGAAGAPILTVMHGREEVMSLGMLSGRDPISPRVAAAVHAQDAQHGSGATTGGSTAVAVHVTTNADPYRIANEVGWILQLQKG